MLRCGQLIRLYTETWVWQWPVTFGEWCADHNMLVEVGQGVWVIQGYSEFFRQMEKMGRSYETDRKY